MALDFPNNPNDGDTIAQDNGVTYKWNAALTRWEIFSSRGLQIDTTIVQVKTATVDDLQTGATTVPLDDSIPQFDEGDAVVGLEIDFVPKFADSQIIITLIAAVSGDSSSPIINAFVIQDNAGGAILTAVTSVSASGFIQAVAGSVELPAIDIVSRNYSIRVGANLGGWSINGTPTQRFFGGSVKATLEIIEIQPNAVTVKEQPVPGTVVGRSFFKTGIYTNLFNQIHPYDDVLPVITDGAEVMSLIHTPKEAGNIIRVEATAIISSNAASTEMMSFLFDGSTNTISTGDSFVGAAGEMVATPLMHELVAADTVPIVFTVRCACNKTNDLHFNGVPTGGRFGGSLTSYIAVTEFAG